MLRPRLRGVALVALLATLVVPATGQAATCAAVETGGDGWERVAAPPDFGDRAVTRVAVSPFDRSRLWASDGFVVVHSGDGGCTWELASAQRLVSVSGEDETGVTQVLVSGPPRSETLWVVETGSSLAGEPPATVVSSGPTGQIAQGRGLPPVGRVRLAVGRDGRSAVAVVEGVALLTRDVVAAALYTTLDAGRTWVKGADLPEDLEAVGVAVGHDGTAYVWSEATVMRSTDRGATLQPVELPSSGVRALLASDRLTVLDGGVTAHVSTDRGQTFRSVAVPQAATGGTALQGSTIAVTTASDVVLVDTARSLALDVSPTDLVVTEPVTALGAEPAVVALAGGALAVLPLEQSRLELPRLRLPVTVRRPPATVSLTRSEQRPAPASLTPAALTLELDPGETRRVDYRLELPPVPGPLDVFFLIDTTASMDDTIDGIRRSIQSIVDSLAATSLDVQMGLGDFRDIDQVVNQSHTYKRQQRIAPPGEGLRRALAGLQTLGGPTEAEADTIALVQAATGSGQLPFVAPGQGAGWRAGTTRVIVHVTDAPFQTGPPYPDRVATVAALASVRAKVLGIAVDRPSRAKADLDRLATATRTFAPEGGIDCTGDGRPDLEPGEPAVCETARNGRGAGGVGSAIIELLRSVEQPGRVSVSASGPAVRSLGGQTARDMDLAHPDPLSLSALVGCDKDQAGAVLPAQLSASNGTREVATATLEVRCRTVPVAPAVAALVAAVPPPPAVLQPAVAPPPPAPVTQAQPAVNPQAAPQPGTVVNANLLALTVEEQQEQLELVLAQQEAESFGEELAMVARARREDAVAARLATATALALATACGVVHWRRRERPVPVRAR